MKCLSRFTSLLIVAAGMAVTACAPPPLGITVLCDGTEITVDWSGYDTEAVSFDVRRAAYPGPVPGGAVIDTTTDRFFTETVSEGIVYFYSIYDGVSESPQIAGHCGRLPEPTPAQLERATAAACAQNAASDLFTATYDLEPVSAPGNDYVLNGEIPHDLPAAANRITTNVTQVEIYEKVTVDSEYFLDLATVPYVIAGWMDGMLGMDDSGWMIGLGMFTDVSHVLGGDADSLDNSVSIWTRYDVANLDKVPGSGYGYASFCSADPLASHGPFGLCWGPGADAVVELNIDTLNECP